MDSYSLKNEKKENSNLAERCRGKPVGSILNSYYIELWERILLLSLD